MHQPSIFKMFITNVLSLFSKDSITPKNYTEELKLRLYSITCEMNQYTEFTHQDRAAIIYSTKNAHDLIDLLDAARNSIIGSHVLNAFNRRNGSLTNPILLVWSKDNYEFTTLRLHDTHEVEELLNPETKIVDMAHVESNTMYRINKKLNWFYRMLKNACEDDQQFDYVSKISLNQNIVDYILKLEAIGDNEDVFEALTLRDNEWLNTFFQPLEDIIDQFKLDMTGRENRRISHADIELEKLINWSSPKVTPLDDIMNNESIQLVSENLLDNDLFNNDKKMTHSTDIPEDFAKDQAILDNLLNN